MKGSRKLLISVIALVITLAMAVTSTYAWFTTNTYVSVTGFNVEVKEISDEGLFIRLAEVDMSYGKSVSVLQIQQAITANNGTMDQLEPLTTSDGTSLKQADSVISGDSTVAAGEDAADGMYAKFTLMFQSTKAGVIVLMGERAGGVAGLESTIKTSGTAGGVFTAWDYSGVDTGITQADLLADATNYQLGNLALPYASGTSVPIRAANAARVTFDSQTAGDQTVVWGPNAFNTAIQKGYYLNAYSWAVTLPTDYRSNGEVIDSVELAVETDGEVTNTPTVLCTLVQSGSVYVGTITVYIWIDGNDGSCINNISSDAFTVAMEFRRIDG